MSHTLGPWMWDDDGNLYPEGPWLAYKEAAEAASDDPNSVYPEWVEPIAQTDNGCYGPRGGDRTLIAAAPDLLLACKMALNDRMFKDWPTIAPYLIAAIAKAEGDEQ